MFEKNKDSFYQSLGESIKNRKEALNLHHNDILKDERRVPKIVRGTRNEHYPYLICRGEYPRLNYLFLCEDQDSFKKENDLHVEPKELIKKSGSNYDEMLWGHIDWDKMFQDVITELSESDISEKLGKDFEDTLIDYAPYAVIRYDEIPKEYARIYITQEEREEKRQNAIERVHLRHGSGLFKQMFYEKFSGKTLREFDKEFDKFISDYLEKRKPNKSSLGLQIYNAHINLSKYALYWQNISGVQYDDVSDEESALEKLLKEYTVNVKEQMLKLAEYQQKFDALHIDIK